MSESGVTICPESIVSACDLEVPGTSLPSVDGQASSSLCRKRSIPSSRMKQENNSSIDGNGFFHTYFWWWWCESRLTAQKWTTAIQLIMFALAVITLQVVVVVYPKLNQGTTTTTSWIRPHRRRSEYSSVFTRCRWSQGFRHDFGGPLLTPPSLAATATSSAENNGLDERQQQDQLQYYRQRRRLADHMPSIDEYYQQIRDTNLPQFGFDNVETIQVLGPTRFPTPTALAASILQQQHVQQQRENTGMKMDHSNLVKVVPALTPIYGHHRPDQDAVFAYAAEYPLANFIGFVQSLRNTGYEGDIVLAISSLDWEKPEIQQYLTADRHLIIYIPQVVCFNLEQDAVASVKGGIRTCICDHLYGTLDPETQSSLLQQEQLQQQQQQPVKTFNNGTVMPLKDPRDRRTVATIRYEVFWIAIQHYQPTSWIFLVDARDTFFQSNPFIHLPRNTDPSGRSGLLYMFGEHMAATKIGQSVSNMKWIRNGYGDIVAESLQIKPTVCSGATFGEAVALETYLRAMVAEADETGVVLMGSDQGFHNFLYYSGKLRNADTIYAILVFDQGTGLVNHLGAMRTAELSHWGNGQIVRQIPRGSSSSSNVKMDYQVLNWDGTLSPVVHQFDRHRMLSDYFFKQLTGELMRKWKAQQQAMS